MHMEWRYRANVLAEAWRVLRSGGWLIFNDVMSRPSVFKEDPSEEPPMLNDVELSALGSVEHYKRMGGEAGFGSFHYDDFSDSISKHYSSVETVLSDLKKIGDLREVDVLGEYVTHMSAGLSVWENCGEKNLHWGVITMQKTGLSSSQPDSPRAEHISKIP